MRGCEGGGLNTGRWSQGVRVGSADIKKNTEAKMDGRGMKSRKYSKAARVRE